MKSFIMPLLLTLVVGFTSFATPIVQPNKKSRPTQLARFQTGSYLAADGTKLRVNVDKQVGGQVFIRLTDQKGTLYFDKTLSPAETTARLSMNLAGLTEGEYLLKISNGLEMEVHEIKISTQKPTIATRSITVL